MTTQLPCGCVRGSFLCVEAERLWQASNGAWHMGNEADSKRLREQYEAHFQQSADDVNQEDHPCSTS